MKLIPRWIRRPFEDSLGPIADRLIVAQVHPNTLTTLGFATLVASSGAFAMGAVRAAGALLLLSGVLDMLDGKVARAGGRLSRFGAFYDSTLDRVGEAALFGGITVFFMRDGVPEPYAVYAVMASMVAMSAGLIVSYARARAESLMLECKVGVAQRAERILLLGVPMMFLGPGRDGMLLLGIVSVLALLAVITVIQRVHHVYKLTRSATRENMPRQAVTGLADSMEKGQSGD
ncbi:MAG: CDP-alcohol phosphatidyltransferase family protein [Gemmatimonadetes bacterium]|nr:CDP-alcohol phosphatidyltransferase family protein [Gemmatimonadota bacterium]